MDSIELKSKLSELRCSGILLDLDNTIYPYESAHNEALRYCRGQFNGLLLPEGVDFDICYKQARSEVHGRLEGQAGMHSRLLYFQTMFEHVYGRTEFQLSLDFEEYYWSTFLENMRPDYALITALEDAVRSGIRICLLTDLTAQIQHRKVLRLNISSIVSFMVSSEECGTEKPSVKMFELGLTKLGISASDALVIGDSISKDIEGARLSGIDWIQYSATE